MRRSRPRPAAARLRGTRRHRSTAVRARASARSRLASDARVRRASAVFRRRGRASRGRLWRSRAAGTPTRFAASTAVARSIACACVVSGRVNQLHSAKAWRAASKRTPRSMIDIAPSIRNRTPSITAARCQGSISRPSAAAWRRTASSRLRQPQAATSGCPVNTASRRAIALAACSRLPASRAKCSSFAIPPDRLCGGNSRVATVVIGDAGARECGCSP